MDIESLSFEIGSIELDEPIIKLSHIPAEKDKIQGATQEVIKIDSATARPKFFVSVDALNIKNAELSSQRGGYSNGSFDAEDINIENFNLLASKIELHQDSVYAGSIASFTAKLNNKFNVRSSSIASIAYQDDKLVLEDFNFKTDESTIVHANVTLANPNDIERAIVDASLDDVNISMAELLYFNPKLKSSQFVMQNRDNIVHLSGTVKGRADNIRAENITLAIGESTFFKGDIRGRNLTQSEGELINLDIEVLTSDVVSLRSIIPGFNPPANFNKLGAIQFTGKIDGYFNDFVTFGNVNTQLGAASLDIRLDTKNGIPNSSYSGSLALDNFDLKTWSDNDDLGVISFNANIEDGEGLTLANADVSLAGVITAFDYKDYLYQNINVNGALSENLFNGKLEFADDNADFDFDGVVDFTDSIPAYKFKADIKKIDLPLSIYLRSSLP